MPRRLAPVPGGPLLAGQEGSDMSLYTELVAAGIEVSNWQSDLYFPVTKEAREILARHPVQKANATTFKSQTTGRPYYDVPFAYDPFWEARRPRLTADSDKS